MFRYPVPDKSFLSRRLLHFEPSRWLRGALGVLAEPVADAALRVEVALEAPGLDAGARRAVPVERDGVPSKAHLVERDRRLEETFKRRSRKCLYTYLFGIN